MVMWRERGKSGGDGEGTVDGDGDRRNSGW